MKSKGLIITLIVMLSITCIGLGAIMVLMINGKLSFRNFSIFGINKVSTTKILDEVYDTTIENINITTDISNIWRC